jgi:hypothetical protein
MPVFISTAAHVIYLYGLTPHLIFFYFLYLHLLYFKFLPFIFILLRQHIFDIHFHVFTIFATVKGGGSSPSQNIHSLLIHSFCVAWWWLFELKLVACVHFKKQSVGCVCVINKWKYTFVSTHQLGFSVLRLRVNYSNLTYNSIRL